MDRCSHPVYHEVTCREADPCGLAGRPCKLPLEVFGGGFTFSGSVKDTPLGFGNYFGAQLFKVHIRSRINSQTFLNLEIVSYAQVVFIKE